MHKQLSDACKSILGQLEEVVQQLTDDDFCRPSAALNNATVGQHLRHTLEFFICLEAGFRKGIVNYDKRAHDKAIEGSRYTALAAIQRIKDFVWGTQTDLPMKLEVGYDRHSDECMEISTNYFRELVYNIEHAIHHMAIMKIGVREVAPYVQLSSDFGVAVSTVRYHETVAAQ